MRWWRIDAAYGGERFDVHIFSPRQARPPLQDDRLFPRRRCRGLHTSLPPNRASNGPGFHRRHPGLRRRGGGPSAGRSTRGHIERAPTIASAPPSIDPRRDRLVQIAKDLSRSVDYLQTRGDIDPDRLAYFGFSWGAMLGPVMTAAEPRFQAAVLLAGGYRPCSAHARGRALPVRPVHAHPDPHDQRPPRPGLLPRMASTAAVPGPGHEGQDARPPGRGPRPSGGGDGRPGAPMADGHIPWISRRDGARTPGPRLLAAPGRWTTSSACTPARRGNSRRGRSRR